MEHETPCHDPHWVQTFSGTKFHPWNDDPNELNIEMIAHGLAHHARWGGQYKAGIRWFSVAQHAVSVARSCSPPARMWGLFHDAAEFIMGDLARPIKHRLPDFCALENRILESVRKRFGITITPEICAEVKLWDNWHLFNEGYQVLENPDLILQWETKQPEILGARPQRFIPLDTEMAERLFLSTYNRISHDGRQESAA